MTNMTEQPLTIAQVERFLCEDCVGPEEAALILKMSGSNFRNLVAAGEAPQPLRGMGTKSVKYPRREIEALAAKREKAAAEAKAATKVRRSNRAKVPA